MTNDERLRRRAKAVREWRARNPDTVRAYSREYYRLNRAAIRENQRTTRKANLEKRRNYFRTLRRTNRQRRLYLLLGCRINKAVRGHNKSAETMALIGCDIPHLMAHLEKQFRDGMQWSNHGTVWHIDHKRPCATFDLSRPEDQRACFHWTNLQPLTVTENLRKGARV